MRKRHTASFKCRVALEAIRETHTLSELSSKHGVHRTQVQEWKKLALEVLPGAFEGKKKGGSKLKEQQQIVDELYRQIGQLKVENDWLKKKSEVFGE